MIIVWKQVGKKIQKNNVILRPDRTPPEAAGSVSAASGVLCVRVIGRGYAEVVLCV